MATLLIVEDQPNDLRIAAELVRSLGFTDVQARTSAAAAKLYLETLLNGQQSPPDVVVLDLDLGYDSGFELLRFWHSKRELLRRTRLIVWTIAGEEQQEICRFFKVNAVIDKTEGMPALKKAIQLHMESKAS